MGEWYFGKRVQKKKLTAMLLKIIQYRRCGA
jgi:hypothetical protein